MKQDHRKREEWERCGGDSERKDEPAKYRSDTHNVKKKEKQRKNIHNQKDSVANGRLECCCY